MLRPMVLMQAKILLPSDVQNLNIATVVALTPGRPVCGANYYVRILSHAIP